MPKEKHSLTNNSSHSAKPYNVSNSFVSRVSSYFPRISNWMRPQADASDEVPSSNVHDPPTDEECDDIEQPPPKQRRIELNEPSTAPEGSFATGRDALASFGEQSDFVDGTIAGPSGLQQRMCLATSTPAPSSRPILHLNLKRANQPLTNGDDQSVHSESSVSTSGCSSLIPQGKSQQESRKQLSTNEWSRLRSESNNLSSQPRSRTQQRNANTGSSSRLNLSLRSGRPSFDPSVFSNPLAPSGHAADGDRVSLSPFYPGRTQFGGASAYRKPRNSLFLPNTTPQPLRQTIQVRPMNSTELSDLNSYTSRRILDVLDTLSSPVLDAKRIPVASKPALASCNRSASGSSTSRKGGGPPIQGLTITTVPDLIKQQRRAQLQKSMEAARLIAEMPSLGSSELSAVEKEYKMRLDISLVKHAGKMTSKMKDLEEEMSEEVNLPIVALPISTLPKFDFLATKPPRRKYSFSSPTDLDSKEFLALDPKGSNNFKFVAKNSSHCTSAFGNSSSNLSSQNKINVPDFIPNRSASVEVVKTKLNLEQSKNNGQNSKLELGISAEDHLKTGSTKVLSKRDASAMSDMRFLTNKKDSSTSSSSFSSSAISGTPANVPILQPLGFGNKFKKPAGSWDCATCMVSNSANNSTCVSCTTPKPGACPVQPPVSSLPKPSSDTWECVTCLVRNKLNTDHCVCCESKRVVDAGLVSSKSPPTTGFGDLFKKLEGSWVCSKCMITNKDQAVKCVACEAVKPGCEPPKSLQPASTIKFNFSIPPEASTFKFGIDKAVDVGAKPESSSVGGFQFGSSNKTSKATQQFEFGKTAKPDASTETKNFTFGIPLKSTARSLELSSVPVNPLPPMTSAPAISMLTSPVSSNGPTGFTSRDSDRKRKVVDNPAMAFVNPFAASNAQPANPIKPVETSKNTFAFGAAATNTTTPINFNGLRKEEISLSAVPNVTPANTLSSELSANTAQPSIFSFGGGKSVTSSNNFPSNSAMFGAGTSAMTAANKPTFVFGATTNQTDEPTAKKLAGGFSSVATKESSGFGALTSSAPKFSGTESTKAMSGLSSGFGISSTNNAGTSFGDRTSKSTLSGFPSTTFGGPFSTGNTLKTETSTTNVSPFMFGSSNNNQMAKPSLFPASNALNQENAQFGGNIVPPPKSAVFSFGNTLTEPAPASGGFFGLPQKPTSGFNFGSSNQTATGFGRANNPPPMFGSAPTRAPFGRNGPAIFGATEQPRPGGGFNFSAATATSGYNFGQSRASAPNAFNPNTRPSYNFTGGEIPQFSAAGPGNASPGQGRVIKKAVRRGPVK